MNEDFFRANEALHIAPVTDPSFAEYGRLVTEHDMAELSAYLAEVAECPADAVRYVPDVEDTRDYPAFWELQDQYFGGMDIQIGYCSGFNLKMDAMEFHRASELDIGITDAVLLLARFQDIENGTLNSARVRGYYLAKGQTVELYSTALHFAPCAVSAEPFLVGVVLPLGTNEALPERKGMLFARGKWLIAHPDAKGLVDSGAAVAITGENVAVKLP